MAEVAAQRRSMVLATLFGGRPPLSRLLHVAVWLGVAVATVQVVLLHGEQFVCRPQLWRGERDGLGRVGAGPPGSRMGNGHLL